MSKKPSPLKQFGTQNYLRPHPLHVKEEEERKRKEEERKRKEEEEREKKELEEYLKSEEERKEEERIKREEEAEIVGYDTETGKYILSSDEWAESGVNAQPTEIKEEDHVTEDELKEYQWWRGEGDIVDTLRDKYGKYKTADGEDVFEFRDYLGAGDGVTIVNKGTGDYHNFVLPTALTNQMYAEQADYSQNQLTNKGGMWKGTQEDITNWIDGSFQKTDKTEKRKTLDKGVDIVDGLLDDQAFLDKVGPDFENFNAILRMDETAAYNKLSKALKAKFGEQSWHGMTMDKEFANIDETNLDEIIRLSIEKQQRRQMKRRIQEVEAQYQQFLTADNFTRKDVTNANLTARKAELSADEDARELMRLVKLYNEKAKGEPTAELREELLGIEKQMGVARSRYARWWENTEKAAYDMKGNSISPTSKKAETGFNYTSEEFTNTSDQIVGLANEENLNYRQSIKHQFDENGVDRYISDKQGQEIFSVTINDPNVVQEFRLNGIVPKDRNKHGNVYELPVSILGEYYEQIVKSDGWTLGHGVRSIFRGSEEDNAGFISPSGHFGLTSEVENQTFTTRETRGGIFEFDEDEYADVDRSTAFKRYLKEWRDDRREIVKKGEILSKMHLLNIDPGSNVEEGSIDISDAIVRSGELLFEGVSSMLGDDPRDLHEDYGLRSSRAQNDILESIVNTTDLQLTEEQKERFKRSGAYEVFEGVVGFMPAIAEFAAIEIALGAAEVVTGGLAGAVAAPLQATAAARFASKFSKVYKNSKGVRYTDKEIRMIEKVSGTTRGTAQFEATILGGKNALGVAKVNPGSALNVGARKALGTGGTVGKTWVNSGLGHTYHALREELKMDLAFGEHYEMGAGAGFYAIGRFMPWFKPGKSNILNTILRGSKSMMAGAVSVQTADALHGLTEDIRGNETIQTHFEEVYGDLGLSKTARQFIVDAFVFGIIGVKGWVGKGGGVKGDLIPHAFRTKKGLRGLERELNNRARVLEKELEADPENQKLIDKVDKANELYDMVHHRLNVIDEVARWQDPDEAKMMLDRAGKNIINTFKQLGTDVEFKATNTREGFTDPDAAAQLISEKGKHKILIDTNMVEPGKLPHEVIHLVFKEIFKENSTAAIKFKDVIKDGFKGFTATRKVKKAFGRFTKDMEGKEMKMTMEEMIHNEYGKETESMKAEEFCAYAAEILAEPRYYAELVGEGTWTNLKQGVNRFGERNIGRSLNNLKTKEDVIGLLANFVISVKSGNITAKQVKMFGKIKAGDIYKERVDADSRTTERKQEVVTDKYLATASKDVKLLSAETQSKYDSNVKGKEGVDLKRSIDNLIAPDPKNPGTTVAGKDFDPIIYDMIKGMYPGIYKDLGKRYELALDMVYDLKGSLESKNRGLKGIIEEYHNRKEFGYTDKKKKDGKVEKLADIFDSQGDERLSKEKVSELESKYKAKFGTLEFIKEALAEGYKGKQNLTKTVMQTLALRIHKLAEPYLEEGVFVSRDDPHFKYEEGEGRVEPVEYEFKSANDRAREAKGAKKIDMTKDLKNPDGEVAFTGRDLVNIRKNTTDILATSEIIDLRSVKIAEKINPETIELLKNWLGRKPGDKPGEYYDYQRSVIEKNERTLFEGGLGETRDISTSETSNIGKTWAKPLYKEVGEFTFKELKGIAGKILTPSQKAEGRIKMEKVPYRKGILIDLIFKGRKDEHEKRINTFIPHIAFGVTNKVLRNQLENPRFAAMLKAKNPGIYEGLQFENVLNNVKENIRGTVPKSVSSLKNVRFMTEEYASRIRKGDGARSAMLEIIAKNNLGLYKDEIIGQMNLSVEQFEKHRELIQAVGAGRVAIKEAYAAKLAPKEFKGGFDDINKFILKNAIEYGLDPTILRDGKPILNIHRGKKERELDPIFSKQFAQEFLPEFWNMFGSDFINAPWAKNYIGKTSGFGNQRWGFRELVEHITWTFGKKFKRIQKETGITDFGLIGYRREIADKVWRDGLMLGIDGIAKPTSNVNLKYVKVTDNTDAKKITDDALASGKYDVHAGGVTGENARRNLANDFKKQISPDGTLSGYNKMLKANEGMLKNISEKLFDYIENARNSGREGAFEEAVSNVSYFLQIQTNLGGGLFRGLATHTSIPLNRSIDHHLSLKERYRSEHEWQMANFSGNLLHNILSSSGNKKLFKENLKPSIKEFKQSIISKELQETIDKNGNTTGIYAEKGVGWDSPAKANFLLNREILESMLDLQTGKTYAELFDSYLNVAPGIKALEAAATKALEAKFKKTGLSSKKVNLSKTGVVRRMDMLDKAIAEGRKGKKKDKGITVLDFDDTLATTKSNIITTAPNGKKGKMNAEEYSSKYEDLLAQGYKFDFSEFNKVVEGKLAPLFNKALKLQKKFGPENMFILTARPPEAQKAIFEFLKANGLNIPMKNIAGLGSSTAESKAMWMVEKFSEGYNDFYFADDAIKNVKAVKDVLSQLDVKHKVQQAMSSKKVKLSNDFNKILEESKGIGREKIYSPAKAQEVGRTKGERTVGGWGSEDFMGLVTYAFAGKGKQGEAHKEFFKENLHKPFNRAYLDMHTMKQTISEDYKALRKEMPDIANKLNEKIPGSVYTYDTAVRVDRWTKAGFEIPGLSKTDHKNLLEVVSKDLELQGFSENLAAITKRKEGWIKPTDYWLGETITADLNNVVNKVYRKEVLAEFVENREAMFGKWKNGKLIGENINKIESIYGPKHKEALEDILWRMETGSNRPRGTDSNTNRWMNWVNNAVGTIMFFNQKSAALQTISSVNYVNGKENNPLAAARAFANLPQYCKDFAKIFNSDMLAQRRAGLTINVEAAELITALDGKSNKAQRALAYLLQKGFIPTKYADSFAIATGGATFYRNRVRMYKKEGLDTKEAEKRAWEDFSELTEETQQSSRPDLISMQQASGLGRPVLAFANTPMQMFRRHKRRVQDIANNRGDMKDNVMSALYYGFAQTILFSYLSNAMFAVDEESDDPKDIAFAEKKNSRHIHTIADSYLRGMGTSGAAVSAIKNGVVRFAQEQNKGRNADYGNVVIDMLNVSPPIGSKARKLYGAGKTYKYNRDVIPEMGWSIHNPAVLAVANVISAITNAPTDRVVMKTQNLDDAMNSDFKGWERSAMFMGLNKWALGLKDKELEEVKEIVKEKKKVESKEKATIKKLQKQKEIQKEINKQIEEEKKLEKQGEISDPKCSGVSSKGERCSISVDSVGDKCTIHEKVEKNKTGKKTRCSHEVYKGGEYKQCKMQTSNKSGYCYYHD